MKRLIAPCVIGFTIFALAGEAMARDMVRYLGGEPPGTIVIRNSERALYLTLGQGEALRYTIAVGRQAKQWTGVTHVLNKVPFPTWQPPSVVRRDMPQLPALVPPGPKNPLGTRALVLEHEYAIHGTNAPDSIGKAASYGCFRMHNADVEDLFQRVPVGAQVVVMR